MDPYKTENILRTADGCFCTRSNNFLTVGRGMPGKIFECF